MRKYFKVESGPHAGKFACVGGTVVCDSEEGCAAFEKEYYKEDLK